VMLLVLCSPIFTAILTRTYFKKLDKYKQEHPELKYKLEGKAVKAGEPETALALKDKDKEDMGSPEATKEGAKETSTSTDPIRIEYDAYIADKKQKEEEQKETAADLQSLITIYKHNRFYQAYYASFNLFRGFIVFGTAVWGYENPYACACVWIAVTSAVLLFLVIVRPFGAWKDNICQIGCEILNIIFYVMALVLVQTPLTQVAYRNKIGFAMISVNTTLYLWMLIMSWIQNFISAYLGVQAGRLWWRYRKYAKEDEEKAKKEEEEKKKREEEEKKNKKDGDEDEEHKKLKATETVNSPDNITSPKPNMEVELIVKDNNKKPYGNAQSSNAVNEGDIDIDIGGGERDNAYGKKYSFKTNNLSEAQKMH